MSTTDTRRTSQNLVRHELIGLDVTVVKSNDRNRLWLAGRVIDESKNTLTIVTDDGEKLLPKADATFRFELDTGPVDIDGELLVGRPEERILKKFPRKWE